MAYKLAVNRKFTFCCFYFDSINVFFNISGSLQARSKIKDAVVISMNRTVGKTT